MAVNSDEYMHLLMVDMQISYFMANLSGQNHKGGLAKMRDVARNAIKQRTIPKSLFIFANAFIKSPDPLKMVDETYETFHRDNGTDYESVEEQAVLA